MVWFQCHKMGALYNIRGIKVEEKGDGSMNSVQFAWWLPSLLEGLRVTLGASVIAIITSLIWGAVIAMLVAYDNKVITAIMRVYISIFRNTPLLVIMFFCFYGLPLLGIGWSGLVCGILAITLNEGAFVAELIRGSIKNIPSGEIEAACSLGLKKGQVVRKVIFPLGFRNAIPMLTGQASVIVKDTSLFSLIMLVDLSRAGGIFYDKYLSSVSIWIVAVLYVIIFLVFTQLGRIVEKKLMVRR